MGVEIPGANKKDSQALPSCPARGMGVEIFIGICLIAEKYRHAPRGAWE